MELSDCWTIGLSDFRKVRLPDFPTSRPSFIFNWLGQLLRHKTGILVPAITLLTMINETLEHEIDNAHQLANDAQLQRNFDAYMNVFTDDLQYKQLNGKTIGKKQLAGDVKRYFHRVKSISGSYQRQEINYSQGNVTERLIQHSQVTIRVFIFFSKNWTVEREGIYQWVKENNEWKICRVEVLAEKTY